MAPCVESASSATYNPDKEHEVCSVCGEYEEAVDEKIEPVPFRIDFKIRRGHGTTKAASVKLEALKSENNGHRRSERRRTESER